MGLFSGATKIDAVYFGASAVTQGFATVFPRSSWVSNSTRSVTMPTNLEGDLIVLDLSATPAPAVPAGFTLYKTSQESKPTPNRGVLCYRFAPQGGLGSFSLANDATVGVHVFSGVDRTTPFGSFAETTSNTPVGGASITRSQRNGFALVALFYNAISRGGDATWGAAPTGMVAIPPVNDQIVYAAYLTDRTSLTAFPGNYPVLNTVSSGFWSRTVEILPGQAVSGPPVAQAVYLGSTMVWPEGYVVGPITTGSPVVTVPAAYDNIDVIIISGAGGGSGTPIGGAPGKGGGAGMWAYKTYRRASGDFGNGPQTLNFSIGAGGKGGTNLFPTPDAGVATTCTGPNGLVLSAPGGGGGTATSRTGGTAAPLVFNGRTYTAGAGGTSSNKGGASGTAPGGGGQGGDSGGLTGNSGGPGAGGGIWVYAY